MKTNKGFTLIELLVVVLIIGILAAIAVPKYQIAVLKSKLARAKQTASDIRKAYEIYHLQNGVYPTSFNQLDFANKFDDSNIIDTSDYTCYINSYHEIICSIGVRNYSIKYYINLYTYHTNKITTWCQAESADASSINHKVCQQDTGKTASQAACHGSDYCLYEY